ncbi:hypothetical protein [Tychonema sp. BBK16]|uniref:hypothetical protein n=1 Tax=Tychonema sp. BBK16 TaxID=2699888 RepID=UPI001F379525|nr:hypothetical protein [Tychonema sp. BBK16]MCF6371429.1 hypothetical protein [Tychonema sp. BBK16]
MQHPGLLDPPLLRAAKTAYRRHLELHSEQIQRPIGVVVCQGSDRGQLIFTSQPVLLPGEFFVTFEEIESQMY